jgi:hypothetical protein
MISLKQPNNDIYFFFEGDEIKKLRFEAIHGICFNPKNFSKGESGCSVKEGLKELIGTKIKKSEEGIIESLIIEIMPRVYEKLIDTGSYSLHEGFRHVNLFDSKKLDFSERFIYEGIKRWRNLYYPNS